MTRKTSIRVLAPVLLLLPVVVVSVVILVLTSRSARQAAEAQADAELSRIQAAVADRVDQLVARPMRVTRFNRDLIEAGKLDPQAPADWKQTLLAQAKAYPSLSAVTWGAEDRRATWIARYGRGETKLYYAILEAADDGVMREYLVDDAGRAATQPTSEFAFDPTVRPWYRSAVEANAPVWSEPYAWAGDTNGGTVTIGLSYSQPYPGGEQPRVGVLSAELNLDDVSTFLAGMKIGETGQCFIVDAQGLLVATSTDVELFTKDGGRRPAVAPPHITDESLIGNVEQFWASADQEEGVASNVEAAGITVFTARSSIGGDAGLPWTLVTIIPESDFMAESRRTWMRTLLVSLGVVLLTVVGGVFLSRWISRPVLALEEHVQKIGEGDLDSRIDLDASAEFTRLSGAMNKMSADLKDHFELRRSLAMAMEVQQSLLPDTLPKIDGLEIAGNSVYCDQTGGDYYDFLELANLADHSVAVVVGDVMGHGIAAAMLMATARGIVRSRSTAAAGLGELTGHLNEQLAEVTQGKRFMTMVMASIDSQTREFRWASAGHDPPFIFDPEKGEFIELDGGGLPLGVMAEETYEDNVYEGLSPGTVIAFMTDGVFEARNRTETQYGKERIMALIREHHGNSAKLIADTLEKDLDKFQESTSNEDDITYVIVKVL